MKKLTYLLSACVLIGMLAIVGCSKDEGGDPPVEDQAGANFQGTWAVGSGGSVMYTNEDRTSEYSDFTLNVTYSNGTSSGSYSASGGPDGSSPWPSSGSWSFDTSSNIAANSFKIVRADGLVVTVTLTETNMTLTFTYDDSTHDGSRTEAVNGNWTFNLEKQ